MRFIQQHFWGEIIPPKVASVSPIWRFEFGLSQCTFLGGKTCHHFLQLREIPFRLPCSSSHGAFPAPWFAGKTWKPKLLQFTTYWVVNQAVVNFKYGIENLCFRIFDAQKALPILIAIFQGGWRAIRNTRLVDLPQILVETQKCRSWIRKKRVRNNHIDPPRLVNSSDLCLFVFWRPTVSHKSEDKFRVKTRDRIKPAELGLFCLFFIQPFHLSYCPTKKLPGRVIVW